MSVEIKRVRPGKKLLEADRYCKQAFHMSLKEYMHKLTAEGYSNIEIGKKLKVSRQTIAEWKKQLGLVIIKHLVDLKAEE